VTFSAIERRDVTFFIGRSKRRSDL